MTKESKDLQAIVLGSALVHREAAEHLAMANLPEDIFEGVFRTVYTTWRKIAEPGRYGSAVPTVQSILMALPVTGEKRLQAEVFLEKLVQRADEPSTMPFYLEQLVNLYKVRRLQDLAQELSGENREQVDQTIGKVYDMLFNLESIGRHTWAFARIDEAASQLIDKAQQIKDNKLQPTSQVPTGFDLLDDLTNGGIARGTISLWAGRPGMGKTAVLCAMALHIARQGIPCVFFSLEMPMEQLLQRMLAQLAEVSYARLQNPVQLEDPEWHRLYAAERQIADWPLWIEDNPGMTVGQLYTRAQWYVQQKGVQAIFLDYVQLLRLSNGRTPENEGEWNAMGGVIWQMTRELNVAGYYAVQLNREVEKRPDKRPKLSDIRNTGRFENDASYVVGLYRDEYYNREDSPAPNIIELVLLKHRFGPVGTAEVYYEKDIQSVRSIAVPVDEALKELEIAS